MIKKYFNIIKQHNTVILTLVLGFIYFSFLLAIHDSTLHDYQIFVRQPLDELYFIDRWNSWSSRLFIESAVNIFSKHMWAWQILTVGFGVLLFWGLARILAIRRVWQVLVLFSLMLLVNTQMLATAGIFATTINYLWPLASLVFVSAVLFKPFKSKVLRVIANGIALPLMIFAVCSEQIAVLALLLGVGYVLYQAFNKQKIAWGVWFYIAFGVLGVVNVLISPGNDARTVIETANWWPEFVDMGLIEKLTAGSVVTFSRLFFAPEFPAMLLVVVLAVLAFAKKNIKAFTAILPSLVLLGLFLTPLSDTQSTTGYIQQTSYFNEIRNDSLHLTSTSTGVPQKEYIAIFSFIILSIATTIYLLYGRTSKTAILLWVLGSGLAASLLVSLSPTLYGSSTRTLYPFVIILVGVNYFVLKDALVLYFQNNKTKA